MRLLVIAVLLTGTIPGRAAEPVLVTPLLDTERTAAGQPITPPAGPLEVRVSRFEIAPGARLPVHRHPYPRYAYVEAGTLSVTNAETGQATVYHAGEFVIEMVGIWHYGVNVGTDPVVLIVTDQTPPGARNTELRGH